MKYAMVVSNSSRIKSECEALKQFRVNVPRLGTSRSVFGTDPRCVLSSFGTCKSGVGTTFSLRGCVRDSPLVLGFVLERMNF